MQDHTEGSSMHSQALQTIQERLREADTALRREQDNYRQMQVHVMSFIFSFFNVTVKYRPGNDHNVLILCFCAERVRRTSF